MHIDLDYARDPKGRLEGTVRVGDNAEAIAFGGTIDLLRILEDLAEAESLAE